MRGLAPLLFLLALLAAPARAAEAVVVALGASNTSGWGVGEAVAYPALLEGLLRAEGLDVRVVNAGRPFDTTGGMLARLDAATEGAAVVVLQPGANDLRFLGTRAQRSENIATMVARLEARGVRAIVYDPEFPADAYQWDGIHINAGGHARIARALLPEVIQALRPPTPARGARRARTRP